MDQKTMMGKVFLGTSCNHWSSSSHVFTISESTNLFHEISFVLFLYNIEVFFWDQKYRYNWKNTLQPFKKWKVKLGGKNS